VGTYHLQAVVDSVGGSWGGREKIQGCSRSNNMRKVVEERSLRVGAGLKNKQFWCCVVSEEQLWSALVPARPGNTFGNSSTIALEPAPFVMHGREAKG
jgi:hypothetical protein